MDVSVEKIANLAYLKLSDVERSTFEKQFVDILKYVEQLQKVPMSPSEAKEMGAFHVSMAFYKALGLDPSVALREDGSDSEVNTLTLTNEEALKGSPKSSGLPGELLYEVPSIIER